MLFQTGGLYPTAIEKAGLKFYYRATATIDSPKGAD